MTSQAEFVSHVLEPIDPETLQPSSQDITYFVGHRHLYPLKISIRGTLYIAHCPESLEPLAGPVKELTVLHVGSEKAPDVSTYAQTCTSLSFRGHISSVNGVFGIVEQLPKLEKLSISIGDLQGLYEPDDARDITVCPSVKELKILIDQNHYNSLLHRDCGKGKKRSADCAADICMSATQQSIVWLTKVLIIFSMGVFPNLEHLEVDSLGNGVLDETVSHLIRRCPIIKKLAKEAQAEKIRQEKEKAEAKRILQNPSGPKRARAPLFISF